MTCRKLIGCFVADKSDEVLVRCRCLVRGSGFGDVENGYWSDAFRRMEAGPCRGCVAAKNERVGASESGNHE